jgi:outer membrane biosynthesis protein TonB
MNRPILCIAMALFAPLFPQTSIAQTPGHVDRKLISKIAPSYPEVAKQNHIKGFVKLEVVVGKNGSVQSMKVLGGKSVFDRLRNRCGQEMEI